MAKKDVKTPLFRKFLANYGFFCAFKYWGNHPSEK